MQRTSTIVVADMVGYSARIASEPEATLAEFSAARHDLIEPALRACEGRQFRLLGDGSLFEFASIFNAVRFSVRLQRALAERTSQSAHGPMRLRIGVHLGDISEVEGDLHGDGVNIAARLQELAEPGGIAVSGTVIPHVRHGADVEFTALGDVRLKNLPDTTQVWCWAPPKTTAENPKSSGPPPRTQILNAQVTDLLISLHMRSARLGLSDGFDKILAKPCAGASLAIGDIYSELGFELNNARQILNVISIRPSDDFNQIMQARTVDRVQFGEFIASITDNAKHAFAVRLLPEVQGILQSQATLIEKRQTFMRLIEDFMAREYVPLARRIIGFGFIEL